MDALLIGSRAMQFWFKHSRKPHDDYDFFITKDAHDRFDLDNKYKCRGTTIIGDDIIQYELKIGTTIGLDNDKYESVKRFMEISKDSPEIELFGLKCKVATPSVLMAIKRSHLRFRHNWLKHMNDYSYLQSRGIVIDTELDSIMRVRENEREAREKSARTVNLNMSNEDFFDKSDEAVRRKFVHDDLHKVVAFYDEPLFNRVKNDKSQAMVDQGLFDSLPIEDQRKLVMEEAYVIGLERLVIPKWYNIHILSGYGMDVEIDYGQLEDQAYQYALERICTDLTKGWFREFAIDNYTYIRDEKNDFVNQFIKAVESKELKLKDA